MKLILLSTLFILHLLLSIVSLFEINESSQVE